MAIKQLNPDGNQGNQEFIVEVNMLSVYHHPNLVTLIGDCTSGAQRLLVYEYMPMGSLEDHLYGKSLCFTKLTKIYSSFFIKKISVTNFHILKTLFYHLFTLKKI